MVSLAHDGMTMVVVTHEMGFARKAAERIIFMADGTILEDTDPESFFSSPESERARDFLSIWTTDGAPPLPPRRRARGPRCGRRAPQCLRAAEPRNLLASIRSGYVVLGTKYDQPGLGLRDPVDNDLVGFDPTVSRFVVNHIAQKLGVPAPALSGGKRRRRNARR